MANPEVPNSEVLAMLLDNMESLGLVKLEPNEAEPTFDEGEPSGRGTRLSQARYQ
jgi:hypothetical protein